jgi:hypothetical protein
MKPGFLMFAAALLLAAPVNAQQGANETYRAAQIRAMFAGFDAILTAPAVDTDALVAYTQKYYDPDIIIRSRVTTAGKVTDHTRTRQELIDSIPATYKAVSNGKARTEIRNIKFDGDLALVSYEMKFSSLMAGPGGQQRPVDIVSVCQDKLKTGPDGIPATTDSDCESTLTYGTVAGASVLPQ